MRLVARSASVVALVVVGLFAAPSAQAAGAKTCGEFTNYAYAGQYTSQSATSDTCFDTSGYFGWAGIDGAVTTPATYPAPLDSFDHNLGTLNAQFSVGSSSNFWIQIGWMFGAVGPGQCTQTNPTCLISRSNYSLYFETNDPDGYYSIAKVSNLSLSTSVTYRVQYASTDGCWHAYYNYNTQVSTYWCNYPTSGEMGAWNEIYSNVNYVQMPISDFGSSTPNTNSTLRLLGASGWRDWTSAATTTTVQNRPYFYWSPFVSGSFIHFRTYGAVH